MAIEAFSSTLNQVRNGGLHDDLSVQLNDLIQKIKLHNKPGELVLSLKVAPIKGDASTVVITDEIKVKAPKKDTKQTIFFTTNDGNLSRKDPNQRELGLEVVRTAGDEAAQTVREVVDESTGEIREVRA